MKIPTPLSPYLTVKAVVEGPLLGQGKRFDARVGMPGIVPVFTDKDDACLRVDVEGSPILFGCDVPHRNKVYKRRHAFSLDGPSLTLLSVTVQRGIPRKPFPLHGGGMDKR